MTVTKAVLAVARFVVGTAAVNCVLLTNVVTSGAPFQLTVAPDAKPAPFTVKVMPELPGATLVGMSGKRIFGAAFEMADPLAGI